MKLRWEKKSAGRYEAQVPHGPRLVVKCERINGQWTGWITARDGEPSPISYPTWEYAAMALEDEVEQKARAVLAAMGGGTCGKDGA